MVLWCYLIWYLVTVCFRFDANSALWLNSAGISGFIGIAFMLSVRDPTQGKLEPWQVFRLFAMPFCVSSFAALIKGQDYVLVVPMYLNELSWSAGLCAVFVLFVLCLKRLHKNRPLADS